MLIHKAIVTASDVSQTYQEYEITEPTVALYRDITYRTATDGPILRMTIPQVKTLIKDLGDALNDLSPFAEDR